MYIVVNIILWVAYLASLYFSIFLVLVYFDKKSLFKTETSSIEPTKFPFVSIIIPAYNEENTILGTLKSVDKIDYPKEKIEILVINDGSTDKTKQKIEQFIKNKPEFELISHHNKGKAASMNIALQKAKGDFFACLDADSFVDPLTLKKMLAFYYNENDPKLVIVTPAMKVYKPKNILQKIQWLEYLVMIFVGRLTSHLDSLYVAPGPFSIYRTDIIKKLGGFDEHNLTEDQEIAYRVQKHNYKIKQCFDGYVYTTAPHKLVPFYKQRRRWYLGSLSCVHKYREMVANRKYGDFGMMQMVKNVFGYVLAITGITIAIYLIFLPFLEKIKNLLLIKFNIAPFILGWTPNFSLLNILSSDFRRFFIIIFLFAFGLFFFYQAHKNTNEKIVKFGWIPIIPYFLFYYLLKGSILLLSLFEFTRGKRIKW